MTSSNNSFKSPRLRARIYRQYGKTVFPRADRIRDRHRFAHFEMIWSCCCAKFTGLSCLETSESTSSVPPFVTGATSCILLSIRCKPENLCGDTYRYIFARAGSASCLAAMAQLKRLLKSLWCHSSIQIRCNTSSGSTEGMIDRWKGMY